MRLGGTGMGLFELDNNNLTGNTLSIGDLIITWDEPEELEGQDKARLKQAEPQVPNKESGKP